MEEVAAEIACNVVDIERTNLETKTINCPKKKRVPSDDLESFEVIAVRSKNKRLEQKRRAKVRPCLRSKAQGFDVAKIQKAENHSPDFGGYIWRMSAVV